MQATRTRAGWYLTHPAMWLAILLLLVNDHVLKEHWPGWLTGKLSDFAGMVFFPLILVGIVDLCSHVWGADLTPRRRFRLVALAVVATAIVFTAIQLSGWAEGIYLSALSFIQWPYHAITSLARRGPLPSPVLPQNTADPTDLVALIALVVPVWLLRPTRTGARRSGLSHDR